MNELAGVDFVELGPEELWTHKHRVDRGERQLTDEAKHAMEIYESMFPRYAWHWPATPMS